ncbi:MAG TPA: hypothetical protein VI729_07110 [Anaerolineales bacterium]|nr:hypothetical protein [Anaerolineales bacterium]
MRLVGLGISWTIATFAGYILATFLGIGSFLAFSTWLGCDLQSAAPIPDRCNNLYYLALFLAALFGGASLGLTQFAILRLFDVPSTVWWIPATALAFAVPVTLEIGLADTASMAGGLSLFVFLGFSLGIAQWLVLRRRLSRSGVWIAATVASTITAGLLSSWTIGSPFIWFAVGAGTALALIWLVRPRALPGTGDAGA